MPCIIVLDVSFMRINDYIANRLAKLPRDFVCVFVFGGGGVCGTSKKPSGSHGVSL